MSDEQQGSSKRSAWPIAIVLLVVMLVYVLSYAPVVRLKGGFRKIATTNLMGNPAVVLAPIHGDDLMVYKPVDWLIDETPLREPLLWWAGVWGVRGPFVEAMMWRPRGTAP